jgi:hypothetical protein
LLHSATMPSHSCSVCFWLGSPTAFCRQARGCRQHAVSSTSSCKRLPPHAAPGTAAHAIGLLPNARPPIHLGGVGNVHCIVAEQHAGVGKVGEVEEDLGGGATPHLHHACRQVGVWGGRSVQSEGYWEENFEVWAAIAVAVAARGREAEQNKGRQPLRQLQCQPHPPVKTLWLL